jgi:hypothetical protein
VFALTKKLLVGLLLVFLLLPVDAAAAAITVDGLDDDWAGIEPLGKSILGQTTMWAFVENGNLYVLVKGRMGDWNDIFLDVDNDSTTGHQSWIWSGMGADYLMEDGFLFISTGPGWEWEEIGAFEYETTGEGDERIIEMALPLEMVGLTGDVKILIGFSGGEQHIPSQGKAPFVIGQ